MEWIVSLTAIVFLIFMVYYFLSKKDKPREISAIVLVLLGFIVYHIGDAGLWAGWKYELVRRIASIGFYFEIPFMILLLYYLVPKEKKSMLFRWLGLILILPWLAALIMVYKYPLVYLEGQGEVSETFVYALVLSFILAVIFLAVYGFSAVKWRNDVFGKKLSRMFSIASIVLVLLYVILWSSIDAFGYDATWLFGLATVIWTLMIWSGTDVKKVEVK